MTTIPARVFPFVLATPPSGKKPFTPLPIKQNSSQNNFLTPLQQDSVLFTGNNPGGLSDEECHRYRSLCSRTKRNKQEQQEYDAFAKRIRNTRRSKITKIRSITSQKKVEGIKLKLRDVLEETFPDVYKPDLSRGTSDQKKQWRMATQLYERQNWHLNTLLADLGKTLEKEGYTAKSPPTDEQLLALLPGLFTPQKIKSFGLVPHTKKDSASRNANGSSSSSKSEEHTSPPEQQQQRASSREREKDSSPFPVLPPSETQTSPEERDSMLAEQQSRDYFYWGTIPD
jgi:hypothetical protein